MMRVVRLLVACLLVLVACSDEKSAPGPSATRLPAPVPAGGIRTVEEFRGKSHDLQRWMRYALNNASSDCKRAAERLDKALDKHGDLIPRLRAFRVANRELIRATSDGTSPTEEMLMPRLWDAVSGCEDDPDFAAVMSRVESLGEDPFKPSPPPGSGGW